MHFMQVDVSFVIGIDILVALAVDLRRFLLEFNYGYVMELIYELFIRFILLAYIGCSEMIDPCIGYLLSQLEFLLLE